MSVTELKTIDPTPVDCRSWRRFRYEVDLQDLACRMFRWMAEDGYIENDSGRDVGVFASMLTDMLFDPNYDGVWEELIDLRDGILDEEMTADEFRAWLDRGAAFQSEHRRVPVTAGDYYEQFLREAE